MLNLEVPVDQTRDSLHVDTLNIFRKYAPPGYVKQASEYDLRGDDALPNHMFADSINRAYPMHTAAATWLSYAFLHEAQHSKQAATVENFDNIESRLRRQAAFFSTEYTLPRPAVVDKTAADLSDEVFAMVWIDSEGNKQRQYPLRNGTEAGKAASWLVNYRDDFVWQDRHTIARKILTKSAEYGSALPEDTHNELQRMAGHGIADNDTIATGIRKRAALIQPHNYTVATQLRDIAAAVRTCKQPLSRKQANVLVDTLDDADRQFNLTRLYQQDLPRPEQCVFEWTANELKQAAASFVEAADGSVYSKADFDKLKPDVIREWVFEKAAAAWLISDVAVNTDAIIQSLPSTTIDIATQFKNAAAACGVYPQGQTPRHQRLSPAQLADFAKDYVRRAL